MGMMTSALEAGASFSTKVALLGIVESCRRTGSPLGHRSCQSGVAPRFQPTMNPAMTFAGSCAQLSRARPVYTPFRSSPNAHPRILRAAVCASAVQHDNAVDLEVRHPHKSFMSAMQFAADVQLEFPILKHLRCCHRPL